MSFEERLEGLSEGRYDVIAYGILATSKLKRLSASHLSHFPQQASAGATQRNWRE